MFSFSRYMFFYQVPFVPELLFQANDFEIMKRIFTAKPMGLINTSNMTPDDLEVFIYTFAQKGNDKNHLIFIYKIFLRV